MGVMEIAILFMIFAVPAIIGIGVVFGLISFARQQSAAPIGVPCGGCNAILRPGDQFCASCGQRVANVTV